MYSDSCIKFNVHQDFLHIDSNIMQPWYAINTILSSHNIITWQLCMHVIEIFKFCSVDLHIMMKKGACEVYR